MDTDDTPRTKGGLTLLEAELRIAALEAAAAKAILALAAMVKREDVVVKRRIALLDCVELLFTELKLEGAIHSQFVANSLVRTRSAVAELQQALSDQRSARKDR